MSYAALYLGTKPIIRLAPGNETYSIIPWVRPTDWPQLPTLQANENKFVGLYGVDDTDTNFVAVVCSVSSGTYDVDWGDGTTSLAVPSNTKANKLYDYSTISVTPTSENNWKPVIVTVTPTPGSGNITKIDLQQRNSAGAPNTAHRINWLDISVNAPSMTSLIIGGLVVFLDVLEKVTIGSHSVTNMRDLFLNCSSLRSVPLFNTASVTTMYAMFRGCSDLQSVPLFNTASVTDMQYMFYECVSIQSVPLFNTFSVTNMFGMFQNCYSLQSIPLFNTRIVTNMQLMFYQCVSLHSIPLLNTAAVTNMQYTFQGCNSLHSLPLLNTIAVTNMQYMFQGCINLRSIPLFNTQNVINMQYMFQDCNSLQSIPLLNTIKVSNMQYMFQYCYNLKSIAPLNTAANTATRYMFQNCYCLRSIPTLAFSAITSTTNAAFTFSGCLSLSRGRTSGLRYGISYNACKLTRAGLIDIFNGLGTAAGIQTIDVRNNIGTASLTAADKLIAESKGWTVQTI